MHEIKKRTKKNGRISYTACIRVKGYPTMSATFEKKQEAQLWIQENESKMKLGRHIQPSESKKHTLNDLINRYILTELPKRNSDHQKFKMHLEWWSKEIGCYYLNMITPALITATVNRYLATLSIVFSYACNEYAWLDENPLRKVRKNTEKPTQDRFLTSDEVERLLLACKNYKLRTENYNKQMYLFVLIALSTGARYSEIHRLRWQNIDFINKQFYFLNTKNGENRGIPITKTVFNELIEFQKVRNIKSDYLFTTKDGKKLIDMRVRFYKVLETANIDCRFHDLRHTVASHIAMNGGSLLDIAEVTGHKTMQMVKRYSHLTKKHTANLLQDTTDKIFEKVNEK